MSFLNKTIFSSILILIAISITSIGTAQIQRLDERYAFPNSDSLIITGRQ